MSGVRWFLAGFITALAFRVLNLSDWLTDGKYSDDPSKPWGTCESRLAEAVWRVGNWLYGHGCNMYGELLREKGEPADE